MGKNGVGRKEVAELAGVSEATVSYVLNNTKNVTAAVRERVLRATEQLHYRPNLIAKSLVTKRTNHVAMLVDNLKNPHFCELLEGAQSVASENGYIVSVIAVDTSNLSTVADLMARGVDGVIYALIASDVSHVLDSDMPQVNAGAYVQHDYLPAMMDAVRMLKKNGHERIAFLSGIPLDTPDYGRLDALKQALDANGLPCDPALLIESGQGYHTDERTGMHMADILLEGGKPFTAVIAINDLVAFGACKRFRQRGYSVPDDISVIGCDNTKILDFMHPALSSIDNKSFETGRALMLALIREIAGEPKQIQQLVCDFVNRSSVVRARAGK